MEYIEKRDLIFKKLVLEKKLEDTKNDAVLILKEIEQINKYLKSPATFFIEANFELVDMDDMHNLKGVPLLFYDNQKDLIKEFEKFKGFKHVYKQRGSGITLLTTAYIAWLLINGKKQSIGLMGHNHDASKYMLEQVREHIYKSQDKHLIKICKDNLSEIVLDNGNIIRAFPKTAIRGTELSFLYWDEYKSDYKNSDILNSIKPNLRTGGRILVTESI